MATGSTPQPAPFARALREAIEQRGLSLDRISAHLASHGYTVSTATLSYWQTGRSRPIRRESLKCLGALEEVLQVPRGSLASLLTSAPALAARPKPEAPADLDADYAFASDAATLFGYGWNDGYHLISEHDELVIGPNRRTASHMVSDILVAERDGFDRLLVGTNSEEPGRYVEIRPEVGVRVGRTHLDPSIGLCIVEFLLDHPLRIGEAYSLRYSTVSGHLEAQMDGWNRIHSHPLRDMSVSVTFDEGDLPSEVCVFTGLDEPDEYEFGPLLSNPLTGYWGDFGPGLLTLRWRWAQ